MPTLPKVEATYERPVKGTLMVLLETGETFPVGPGDLKRFDLARPLDLYTRAHDMFAEALGPDFDFDHASEEAQSMRYLIECALMYDHSPWAREDGTPWDGEDAEASTRVKNDIRRAFGLPEVPVPDAE